MYELGESCSGDRPSMMTEFRSVEDEDVLSIVVVIGLSMIMEVCVVEIIRN